MATVKTKKIDRCVEEVEKKIKKGEIDESYVDEEGEKKPSNPYAICKAKIKK